MQMDSHRRKERRDRRRVEGHTDFEPEEEYDQVVQFWDLKLGSITPVVRHKLVPPDLLLPIRLSAGYGPAFHTVTLLRIRPEATPI